MTRLFIAVLLALALAACSGGTAEKAESPTVPQPSQPPSQAPGGAGPAFDGTYAMSAANTGTTGEPGFAAEWVAEPSCASGSCDVNLTISRPGFQSYTVPAEFTGGGAWRWQPVIQFSCPETGSPYEVAAGGFVVTPSAKQRTDNGMIATQLEGTVRVRLTASGCAPMKLSYSVTAERISD